MLQSLLRLHIFFLERESFYLLDKTFIQPYCIFVQRESPQLLSDLAEALESVTLSKADLDLDLPELEAAGKATLDVSDDEEVVDVPAAEDLKGILDDLRRLDLEETRSEFRGSKREFGERLRSALEKRNKVDVIDDSDDE